MQTLNFSKKPVTKSPLIDQFLVLDNSGDAGGIVLETDQDIATYQVDPSIA